MFAPLAGSVGTLNDVRSTSPWRIGSPTTLKCHAVFFLQGAQNLRLFSFTGETNVPPFLTSLDHETLFLQTKYMNSK